MRKRLSRTGFLPVVASKRLKDFRPARALKYQVTDLKKRKDELEGEVKEKDASAGRQ